VIPIHSRIAEMCLKECLTEGIEDTSLAISRRRSRVRQHSSALSKRLRAKLLARDQDLIQWQGYRKYSHVAVFESRLCIA